MAHFHTTKRVEFSETDMAGIVHFSQYFRYMEVIEHEFFRSFGTSVVMTVEDKTISWPRVSCSFDYKQPIHFENIVDMYLNIDEVGTKSLKYTVTIKLNQNIVAIGKSVIVCCTHNNNEIRSISIPDFFRKHLEHFRSS